MVVDEVVLIVNEVSFLLDDIGGDTDDCLDMAELLSELEDDDFCSIAFDNFLIEEVGAFAEVGDDFDVLVTDELLTELIVVNKLSHNKGLLIIKSLTYTLLLKWLLIVLVKKGSLRFDNILELRIILLKSSNDTALTCAAVGALGAEGPLGGLGGGFGPLGVGVGRLEGEVALGGLGT